MMAESGSLLQLADEVCAKAHTVAMQSEPLVHNAAGILHGAGYLVSVTAMAALTAACTAYGAARQAAAAETSAALARCAEPGERPHLLRLLAFACDMLGSERAHSADLRTAIAAALDDPDVSRIHARLRRALDD